MKYSKTYALEVLADLVYHYEELYGDSSALPSGTDEESRKFVTVALNGDGGDENFAGMTVTPLPTAWLD